MGWHTGIESRYDDNRNIDLRKKVDRHPKDRGHANNDHDETDHQDKKGIFD